MKTKKYYAINWHLGYGTRNANTGLDAVRVCAFDSRAERADAVAAFRAPNHCPTARLEAAPAANPNVRRAIRCGDVAEWEI